MNKILCENINKKRLLKDIDKFDFAFQPIIDIHSGRTVAFESLLRNYEQAGYNSISEVFDTAYENKTIYALDILLREKALKKIKDLYLKNNDFVLFYNIDNRILEMNDYENGLTKKLLSTIGFKDNFITFEISEKHEFKSFFEAQTIFNIYSTQGFSTALDDFGTGFSGFKMLYYLNPQYIKIDRFFITDILLDKKKKIFVESMVKLSHSLNIKVVAEGIETKEELNICKEIGCDLVQGYFIQKPTKNIKRLQFEYQYN